MVILGTALFLLGVAALSLWVLIAISIVRSGRLIEQMTKEIQLITQKSERS